MRALSIKQPWAWLILNAGKDVENRTWYTGFRGRILIHTGKTADPPRDEWPSWDVPQDAPMGGIVGMVDIIDCVTESNSDWFNGPYGFVLRNPEPLNFIPWPGKLGFFDVPMLHRPRASDLVICP